MKRLACALVLAGCACAFVSVPRDAQAARTRASSDLHLSVLTPDPAEIGDRVSLDVSFRGGAVDVVELYLDSALVAKRQLGTSQTRGVISFSIDATILAEGAHDVLVKAYGPDGKVSAASGKLRIPSLDLTAPVRIAYPQNGTVVSGIVPIRVALDEQMLRARPYVTFFVDKDLMVLRNYPPYEYNWDTTRVANGWHMLEAWTQMDGATGPTKARPVNVNVNNSGGETRRMGSIPDLRQGAPSKPIVMTPDPAGARTSTGSTPPSVTGTPGAVRSNTRPTAAGAGSRLSQPSSNGYATPSMPRPGSAGPIARTGKVDHPSTQMAGGAISRPSGRLVVASVPRSVLPPVGQTDPLFAVIAPTRTIVGNLMMLVRPGDTLDTLSRRSGVSAAELARLNNVRTDARLKAGTSVIVPGTGSFQVAFDGKPVVFDVLPREENGIRLAPFRQIFEHTGGKLYWFGGPAQTVRAVNSSREVELKIGNARAKVNSDTLLMERAPYLVSGRTIVPLSFVGDALDVKVSFDAKTGRLLLRSAK